jgi:hypothetical protein
MSPYLFGKLFLPFLITLLDASFLAKVLADATANQTMIFAWNAKSNIGWGEQCCFRNPYIAV